MGIREVEGWRMETEGEENRVCANLRARHPQSSLIQIGLASAFDWSIRLSAPSCTP